MFRNLAQLEILIGQLSDFVKLFLELLALFHLGCEDFFLFLLFFLAKEPRWASVGTKVDVSLDHRLLFLSVYGARGDF